MAPRIVVYGKQGDPIYRAAQDKLRHLGLEFDVADMSDLRTSGFGQPTGGAAGSAALSADLLNRTPLISIDGVVYDYPGAMREIRRGFTGKDGGT